MLHKSLILLLFLSVVAYPGKKKQKTVRIPHEFQDEFLDTIIELADGSSVYVERFLYKENGKRYYMVETEQGKHKVVGLNTKEVPDDKKQGNNSQLKVINSDKKPKLTASTEDFYRPTSKPDNPVSKDRERIRVERNSIPAGTKILTPNKKEIEIINYVDTGRRGVVYKVKDKNGIFFALKIAKDDFFTTLDSLKDEVKKAKSVKEVGLRQAAIIEAGKRFVLKEWVEGVRGDEWFKEWVEKGENAEDPNFKKIIAMFEFASKKGTYIGDLNPKNLVLTKNDWVILESGDSRTIANKEEAFARYKQKFAERWAKKYPCKKLYKILGIEKPIAPPPSSWDSSTSFVD